MACSSYQGAQKPRILHSANLPQTSPLFSQFFCAPFYAYACSRALLCPIGCAQHLHFLICRQALEGKSFMSTSMLTIRPVLSLVFCATVQTALRAAVAPWRSEKHSLFVYRKDEDNHCAQHADIPPITIIESTQPISPHASTGITVPRTMCLNAKTAVALLAPCHMAAIIETIVHSAFTPAMWTRAKATA